jgi:hypothetical protein
MKKCYPVIVTDAKGNSTNANVALQKSPYSKKFSAQTAQPTSWTANNQVNRYIMAVSFCQPKFLLML